jgi:hypothetical protein
MEVLFLEMPGGTDDNHENHYDSRCPYRDSIRVPPELKTITPALLVEAYQRRLQQYRFRARSVTFHVLQQ